MPPKPAKLLPAPEPQPAADPLPANEPIVVEDEKVQAPQKPLPPASLQKQQQQEASINLIDIPCVYLLDRHCWSDFKRALNECGLIWGLPDWMTTIVYRGIEWQTLIDDHDTDLAQYFPQVNKTGAGDGVLAKSSNLGQKLVGLLGRPKSLADAIPSTQFCNLTTVEYESERRLPSRQKLWSWLVRSLRGPKPTPGPYHYLVDEVQVYDISYLFKRLIDVLEQVTICSLDDELEIIIKMDFKPSTQNIFSYLGELKKAIKRLNDINERLPVDGRIVLPDSYVRSRLVRAARQVPVYKPVLDRLLITTVNEWSAMTSDDLYHQLEAVCANDQSLSHQRHTQGLQTNYDSLSANSVQFKDKEREKDGERKTGKLCYNFAKGTCSRADCPFLHQMPSKHAPDKREHAKNSSSSKKCTNCEANNHSFRECKYQGVCGKCGRKGHKDSCCLRPRPHNAQAHLSQADGSQIYANMISVEEKNPIAVYNSGGLPSPPPSRGV